MTETEIQIGVKYLIVIKSDDIDQATLDKIRSALSTKDGKPAMLAMSAESDFEIFELDQIGNKISRI